MKDAIGIKCLYCKRDFKMRRVEAIMLVGGVFDKVECPFCSRILKPVLTFSKEEMESSKINFTRRRGTLRLKDAWQQIKARLHKPKKPLKRGQQAKTAKTTKSNKRVFVQGGLVNPR